MLLFIQKQKTEMDKEIKDYFDDNMQQELDIVTSIAGVGQTTAEKFLIEIGDKNKFQSHNQLRAFIGTDPSIKQSGSSKDVKGNISKRGNSHLRRTIWQVAFSVRIYSPIFAEYFQKKLLKEKSINKLLSLLQINSLKHSMCF